ncbi:hypothetical protein BS47DRAFT_1344856 [Hydnum rufescens UP504]|uniref:Uncharacterized protein n=1 Tax=Hydnum rufescens UP504 TaxID=1448309 RepID=A0A9P6AWE4_9AGAM|nr:hypothetical protein BS47DRAFT_1344856 [Hydnum rufescens UP504]
MLNKGEYRIYDPRLQRHTSDLSPLHLRDSLTREGAANGRVAKMGLLSLGHRGKKPTAFLGKYGEGAPTG